MKRIGLLVILLLSCLLLLTTALLSKQSATFSKQGGWFSNVLPLISFGSGDAPGLVVSGKVSRANGQGIPGVKIYRTFASYPGEIVATTRPDGSYQAPFVAIPGDEMVSVWAELPGYSFLPKVEYWRHYYGHEARTVDFTANLAFYIPLIQNGLIAEPNPPAPNQ